MQRLNLLVLRRLRNRLEGLIYTNEKVIDQFKDMVDSTERQQIREILLKSRMALTSGDRADLEAAMFDLNSVSRQLSELMLSEVDESDATEPT